MDSIRELTRRPSPGPLPQPLAFLGTTLWVGCRGTSSLYAIDPQTWSVLDEVVAPGMPFGMAAFAGELRVVISLGEDDDRYLYRFVPGRGFDLEGKTPCPDLTGSHLAAHGNTLFMAQLSYRRILELDENLTILRELPLPSRCAGFGFGEGRSLIITADEEFEDLRLAAFDLTTSTPNLVEIGSMPSDSRSLAFDGTTWWTNYRDLNETASFALPVAVGSNAG
jgi:hypothetical protein